MEWIFAAFFIVSVIHMGEEYFYPGGFMDVMKRLNPKFGPFVTVPMAVIVNGLQLLLCILAVWVWKDAFVFSMSVAGLLFINGLTHLLGGLRLKAYVPGVVTGLLLYVPLSLYAYHLSINSGRLTLNGVIVTGVLGLLYQLVPIAYFALADALRKP